MSVTTWTRESVAFIPSFCVNLDRNMERWRAFQHRYRHILKAVTRWPAVDGSTLNVAHDPRIGSSVRAAVLGYETPDSNTVIRSVGAIGCSLSHIGIWKHIVDERLPLAFVFEDDALLPDKFVDDIVTVCTDTPQHFDVWMFSAHATADADTNDVLARGWRAIEWFCGTYGYLLTTRGAELLLHDALPVSVPVDIYFGLCTHTVGLRVLMNDRVEPVRTGEWKSTTSAGYTSLRPMHPFFRHNWRECVLSALLLCALFGFVLGKFL